MIHEIFLDALKLLGFISVTLLLFVLIMLMVFSTNRFDYWLYQQIFGG